MGVTTALHGEEQRQGKAGASCMAACWRLRVALLLNIMSLSLRAAIVVPAPGAGWQLPMQVGSNLVSKDKVLLEGLPASISTDSTRDPRGAFLSYTVQRAASEHVVSVGRLGCKRFLACSRQKLWWMNPEWGTKGSEIPDETQFLLFQLEDRATAQGIAEGDADPQVRAHQGRENESYGVIFPLISGAFRSSLEASKLKGPSLEHCISLRIESGDSGIMADSIEHVAFVATGSDPFALVRESMQAVQRKLQTFRLRTEKPQPQVIDKFGWCTWDAFYSKVDGPGIEYGVKTLRDGGTPPRMLIIDDGWQDTSDAQPGGASPGLQAGPLTRLTSFASSLVSLLRHKLLLLLTGYHDRYVALAHHTSWHIRIWRFLSAHLLGPAILAEYEKQFDFAKRLQSLHASDRFLGTLPDRSFPKLVARLKRNHGVDLVYCWHALLGYWSGVHPPDPSTPQDAGLAGLGIAVQTPVPTRGSLQVEPRLSWDALTLKGVGISAPERMDEFYERLHSYLRACSVDGVKVDVQAAATMLGAGRGGSAAASREAVQAMERSVVRNFGGENCINCMCHPLECLYAYKDTCVARASEDFYPRDPASHTLHVANVVYNSLFLGEIVIPDWDMFQSNIAVSTLHAVARAVGGCSVYVSDRPGEHDFSLLRRVVMPDGSVLRALQPGKPTRDCLFCDVTTDGTTACKIWNVNACGGGVVAAFNLQGFRWDRSSRSMQPNGAPGEVVPAVSASVGPKDFEVPPPADADVRWAVLSTHWAVSGELIKRGVALMAYDERSRVLLEPKQCAIYTFAPVGSVGSAGGGGGRVAWAVLGMEDMFNAGGALVDASVDDETSQLHLVVRGVGSLLLYASQRPSALSLDGASAEVLYDGEQALLRVVVQGGQAAQTDGRPPQSSSSVLDITF